MKCILIFCSEYLSDKVRETLDGLKMNCFAEVPDVLGCSGQFKHLDTPAFPGAANMFFVMAEDERVADVQSALKNCLEHCEGERCLRAMVLGVEPLV